MMMEAVLTSRTHPEYGELTIPFPIPEEDYDRTLELLEYLHRQVVLLNRSVPGFLVNRFAQALFREAIYLIEQSVTTAADIDRALDNFKTSFAFQSGRLTNPQITYHDTVSIFEKDSVAEYTGVVRSLLEQRNQRLAYEFTRAKLVERALLDIPLVLEVHKLLTNGTYNQSHYIDNGERPGEFKKHDYGVRPA